MSLSRIATPASLVSYLQRSLDTVCSRETHFELRGLGYSRAGARGFPRENEILVVHIAQGAKRPGEVGNITKKS